jgi:hypothetical protein
LSFYIINEIYKFGDFKMPTVMNYQAESAATQTDLIKLIKSRGAAQVAFTLSQLITQSGGSVDQAKLEQALKTYQATPPQANAQYAASNTTPAVPVQEIRRIVKEELRRFNF